MRLPLATDLTSRDGSLDKDGKIANGLVEVSGESAVIRKRPGMYDLGSIGVGAAQLLADWQGRLLGVAGDLITSSEIVEQTGSGSGELRSSNTTANSVYDIAVNGTTWVAVCNDDPPTYPGKGIYRSTDSGQTWTNVDSSSSDFRGIQYGNGVFVAHDPGAGSNDIRYSTDDGATWNTASSGVVSGTELHFVNGLFVVLGSNGALATSSNGGSWTNRTISTTNRLTGIAYGGGTYSVGSVQGNVRTSADLTSWTTTASGASDLFVGAYGNNVFVGISSDYTIWSSANGSTWTQVATLTTWFDDGISYIDRIVFADSYFWIVSYAFANSTLGDGIVKSSDGTTWQYVNTGITGGADIFYPVVYSTGIAAGTLSDEIAVFTFGTASEVITVSDSVSLTQITPSAELFASVTGSAASSQYLFLKSAKQAFLLDRNLTLSQVTDTDYPGWNTHSVTSITRTGTTATVTTSVATNIKTGTTVTITGANQSAYNGSFVVTVTGSNTFTYEVTGSPATPATGTITATGGITTVPGVAFLDGYFFVMDERAIIYGCELNNPANWDALNFITAQQEPGNGVAIAKSQNYVMAFKEWSLEYFYDAGNPTGSPLSPVNNGFVLVGCASGQSVADVNGVLFWVSQTKQNGRGVHMLNGLEPVEISTPSIRRILNGVDLTSVSAYGLRVGGGILYVLTIKNSDITLVFDTQSKMWQQWTSLTLNGSSVSVSSITRSGDVATVVTATAHDLEDGDPVLIAGANQSDYNGVKQISYISETSFSYAVENSPTTPATGTITATRYAETYFKLTKHVRSLTRDLLLHESSGHVFTPKEDVGEDNYPINFTIRTGKFDGGSTNLKTCGKIEVIGNKIDSSAMIRWSDDDYATNVKYRSVDLSANRSLLRRCGNFRRRSFELRHIADTQVQLSELEIELGG